MGRAKKLDKDTIMKQRTVEKTKRAYASTVGKFIRWLVVKHPNELILNGNKAEVKIPLSDEGIIIDFLTDCQLRRDPNAEEEEEEEDEDEDDEDEGKGKKNIAFSTMSGIRSAIVDLYRDKKVRLKDETLLGIKNFMGGYQRIVSALKLSGALSVFEGKKHLTYSGYRSLCCCVLKMQDNQMNSLYAHAFVTLAWNLFARSNSVARLMYHHFEWREDSMLVTLPKHKGDQEGSQVSPKHVLAEE